MSKLYFARNNCVSDLIIGCVYLACLVMSWPYVASIICIMVCNYAIKSIVKKNREREFLVEHYSY